MLHSVHEVNIKKIYKSSLCSTSYFVNVLFTAITLIVPFLLSYGSQDIWVKEVNCREQPKVSFKNEVLLRVDTNENKWIWSTNSFYNQAAKNYLTVPHLKYVEEDNDYDGLNDYLKLYLEVKLKPDEKVVSFQMILIIQYELQCMIDLSTEGLLFVEFSSLKNFSDLHFNGDVSLTQRTLISSTHKPIRSQNSILPHSSTHLDDWKMENILRKYWSRNVTTHLRNVHRTTRSDNEKNFKADITLAYSSQKVDYHPSIWHILKLAWMQYLAFLFIFIYIFRVIKTWLFSNQLCRTLVFDPITKNN